MSQAFSDRSLLFGIVAWKLGLISHDQFVAGVSAWRAEKSANLAGMLIQQGVMTPQQRDALDALVDVHVQTHEYDARRSLAALGPLGSLGERLQQLGDEEISGTLAVVNLATTTDGRGGVAGSERSEVPAKVGGDADVGDRPTPLGQSAVETATLDAGSGAGPISGGAGPIAHGASGGGRFVILRPHAQGGLGRVSLARDDELHREVALKEIRPERADDATSRRRFVREAEITGGLEHPGLAPVYALGAFPNGRPFYALRFIRGESLSAAIQSYHGEGAPRPLELRRDSK